MKLDEIKNRIEYYLTSWDSDDYKEEYTKSQIIKALCNFMKEELN